MATKSSETCVVASSAPKIVHAMEQIRKMSGGSQAHLMRCSDGRNRDLYYIVKFQNNPQHSRILVNELLGTGLASLIGLPTTSTAIVDVGADLIQYTPALTMEFPRRRIPCRAGLQFGSRYPGNDLPFAVSDFLPDQHLREVHNLHDFLGMLVFDKWTCNTDGRQTIFFKRDSSYETVMIDQGFCFNAEYWNFPDGPLRGKYCRLSAYEAVTGMDSFEPWLTQLESHVNAGSILDAAQGIPPEWYEHNNGALFRLIDRLDKRRNIVRELIWTMSKASPPSFPNWAHPLRDRSYGADCLERRWLIWFDLAKYLPIQYRQVWFHARRAYVVAILETHVISARPTNHP
jgi:hypothetical protein